MRATDVCLQTLALASQSCSQLTVSTPTATVQNGTISGLHSGTHLQDFFLGIPYAQPPIHDLRFRNPQSLNVTFDRTFEAIEYSPSCVGYGVRTRLLQRSDAVWTDREDRAIKLATPSQKTA